MQGTEPPGRPDPGALEELYSTLDAQYQPSRDSKYADLVVPQGSSHTAFHRWFSMKEAYSPFLLRKIIDDLKLEGPLRILDPFLGSGTTAVSALNLELSGRPHVAGIEVNPFLAFLSQKKLEAMSLPKTRRVTLAESIQASLPAATRRRPGRAPNPPNLSAFGKSSYFAAAALGDLLKLRANIFELEPSLTRDLLMVALAATVEPVSKLRRDGRALRYEPRKNVEEPYKAFSDRVNAMSQDLRNAKSCGTATVIHGSTLEQATWNGLGGELWDLCVFSPPYPNNIDYTEVYKLEAWFLGLIQSHEEFRQQRKRTIRSHPSILFDSRNQMPDLIPGAASARVSELSEVLRHAIPDDRYQRQRERVTSGYLEDIAIVFAQAYRSLRPGGHLVYVVGNSSHGTSDQRYTIASDLLLAEVGTAVGFEVNKITIARDLRRRGAGDHLRESVVTMQKPTQ